MFIVAGSQNTANIYLGDSGGYTSGGAIRYDNTDDSFFFSLNATERLRITSSGNIGIGTTTPASKLDIFSSTANASRMRFTETGDTSDTNHLSGLDFYDAGTFKGGLFKSGANHLLQLWNSSGPGFTLTQGGNIGIGTTSPWRTLSVTGTVGFDGLTGATGAGSLCLDANKQVVYNSASDSCLSSTRDTKHDIQPLALNALGLIEGLEPVSFVYNEGNERIRFGFIAEDTAAIDPHLATYNASGTVSGIDDRAVLSILVAAIKDLAANIADFAERFTTKELTFDRAYGHELTVDKLCVGQVCVTEADFMAIFGAAAATPPPISVPSSPSNPSEPEPPISVSPSTPETTPDLTNSEQPPHATPPTDAAASPDISPTEEAPPEAANDNAPVVADEPASEPANDNAPPEALTGTE